MFLFGSPAYSAALSLSDDDFEEVDLDFSFSFFGTDYNSIFVGSNGYITFGSGDTDFGESVSELLNDPQPRIAAVWDDLNPGSGGSIDATGDASSMTVSFTGLPEWISTGANTFSIVLFSDGGIDINFLEMSLTDGLVGISPGGGAVDVGETDFSSTPGPFSNSETRYEHFSNSDFDLAGRTISFRNPVTPVPEPGTALLLGFGILSLMGFTRRKPKI